MARSIHHRLALIIGFGMALAGCGDRSHPSALVGPEGTYAPDEPEAGSIPLPRLGFGGGGSGVGDRSWAPMVPGEMVVELSSGLDLPTFHAKWGTSTILELEGGQFVLVEAPLESDVSLLAQQMVFDGDCAIAEPNFQAESPESNQGIVAFFEGDHVFDDVIDQDAMTRIGAPQANLTATGFGVTVAIVDTGIDGTHPDLAGFVTAGYDFIDEDPDPVDLPYGTDADGDGLLDEAAGHGTHVAGIVHAIAPQATLIPVRVLNSDGIGTAVSVARGVHYAVERGAQVINLSLGMGVVADVIKESIREARDAGVVVVSSAGNSGARNNHHFPANHSDVMAVAATNAEDFKAPFSSYGSHVSMSAPGVGILSTYLDHAYAVWSGTSFSTPMVSAAAALWIDTYPASSVDQTVRSIESSALYLPFEGSSYSGKMGHGRLDLATLVLTTP